MNTKMLEKTVHFFNVDLAEDTPKQGYPKISVAAVRICTTKQPFFKISQNSQECSRTRLSFQAATFTFLEKETPAYTSVSFADLYYGKHPVNWENFKGKLYEKWQTDVLIIKKRYREVNTLFEKIDIAMKSVYLRTIDRKLILNLIVIFTFSSQIFLF